MTARDPVHLLRYEERAVESRAEKAWIGVLAVMSLAELVWDVMLIVELSGKNEHVPLSIVGIFALAASFIMQTYYIVIVQPEGSTTHALLIALQMYGPVLAFDSGVQESDTDFMVRFKLQSLYHGIPLSFMKACALITLWEEDGIFRSDVACALLLSLIAITITINRAIPTHVTNMFSSLFIGLNLLCRIATLGIVNWAIEGWIIPLLVGLLLIRAVLRYVINVPSDKVSKQELVLAVIADEFLMDRTPSFFGVLHALSYIEDGFFVLVTAIDLEAWSEPFIALVGSLLLLKVVEAAAVAFFTYRLHSSKRLDDESESAVDA